jgi:hypothetical protein
MGSGGGSGFLTLFLVFLTFGSEFLSLSMDGSHMLEVFGTVPVFVLLGASSLIVDVEMVLPVWWEIVPVWSVGKLLLVMTSS